MDIHRTLGRALSELDHSIREPCVLFFPYHDGPVLLSAIYCRGLLYPALLCHPASSLPEKISSFFPLPSGDHFSKRPAAYPPRGMAPAALFPARYAGASIWRRLTRIRSEYLYLGHLPGGG